MNEKLSSSSGSSFCYSTQTLLKVVQEGAQERSRTRQSMERTHATNQWTVAQSRWQSHVRGTLKERLFSLAIRRASQHLQGPEVLRQRPEKKFRMFVQEAIESTFPYEDVYYMKQRGCNMLFRMCRTWYLADVVFPKALKLVQVDCRSEMDLWKAQLDQEKEERIQSIQGLQETIQRVQRDMRRMTMAFTTTKLESKIQWLRQRKLDVERHQAPMMEKDSIVRRDHPQKALVEDTDPLAFVDVVADTSSSSSCSSRTSKQLKDTGCSSPVHGVIIVKEPLDSNLFPISSSSSSSTTPSSPLPKFAGESVEWIDILDDEYFRGDTSRSLEEETSDWVLCAL